MTAPNLPLTGEDLDYIEDSAEQDMNDLTYLVDCHHFRALIAQARAAIPDPNALPLSTAMREARRRTEAHVKTWVFANVRGYMDRCFRYAPLTDIGSTGGWRWMARLVGEPEWSTDADMPYDGIESAVCRLVTPEVGERMLRGGE